MQKTSEAFLRVVISHPDGLLRGFWRASMSAAGGLVVWAYQQEAYVRAGHNSHGS